MDIVVFGAGSLGSLIGGLLADQHTVTLVGREEHVTAVRNGGLSVEGERAVHVLPAALTSPPAEADLAVVTVKAFDTDEAAEALADSRVGGCLSLQNGMGNEERLVERLDCPVLAGTCTYGARLEEPGRVAYTGKGEVALGPPDGGCSEFADRVGAAFDRAGIRTRVATDMPRRLWKKLAVNVGINGPTALAGIANGALVDGPAREVAVQAARETAAVARTVGVDLPGRAAEAALERVARATSANASSTLQDVRAGRRTEVDAIHGYVVDRAVSPVPVTATLASLLRAWERERGFRT